MFLFATMKKSIVAFCVCIVLASCNEEVTKKYWKKDIPITATAPLFDGPNTLQAQFPFDAKDIDTTLLQENIERVKLSKVIITTSETSGFDSVRNFVLQFASANAAMEKAGVLNPVPKGVQSVDLIPSAETDLGEHFKQSEITIVLDADLEGDREEDLTFTGSMEFEITYKK